ncbi:MAG: TerB family tellurite resistance protein [Gammaproteobacteria bacterium]|jgi:tellurite resistance protein
MLNLLRETVEGIRQRSRHKSFVEAAMAACAMVAMADEDQRLSELITRDRVLVRIDELGSLDHQQAVALYDEHSKRIQRDPARGREQALQVIGAFAGDRDSSELLVQICVAVGRADQTFSATERSVVEIICRRLNLHPGDLGVYDL